MELHHPTSREMAQEHLTEKFALNHRLNRMLWKVWIIPSTLAYLISLPLTRAVEYVKEAENE